VRLATYPAKAILVHEQEQTPDSSKRSYENAPLGQECLRYAVFLDLRKWLIPAICFNCPVWGLNKVSYFAVYF